MRPPRRHRVPIPERCATCSATIPIAAFGGHVGLRKLASGFVVPCGTVTHRALGKRTSAVARGRANSWYPRKRIRLVRAHVRDEGPSGSKILHYEIALPLSARRRQTDRTVVLMKSTTCFIRICNSSSPGNGNVRTLTVKASQTALTLR